LSLKRMRCLVIAAATAFSSAAANESTAMLAELQVVMQRPVDAQLIDWAIHKLEWRPVTSCATIRPKRIK